MQDVVDVRTNIISFLVAQCDARDRQIAELQSKLAEKSAKANGAEAVPTQPASMTQ